MSGFSDSAWKGFGLYYKILKKLHYTKIVDWDPKNKYLCKNEKPQYVFWGVGLGLATVISLGIPGFLFLEFIYIGYNPARNFDYEKIFVILITFIAGVHALPTTIKLYHAHSDMMAGFNLYIRLQRHLQAVTSAHRKQDSTKRIKFDLTTIVVSILGPMLLLFSTGAFIIVFRQADPLSYFIPPQLQRNWGLIIVRIVITWLGIMELVTTLGIVHPTFFALVIHARSVMYNLLFYDLKRKQGCKSKDKPLNRATEVLIYKTYGLAITIMRSYMDVATWFAIFAGVAFGVVGNYAVIKLYERMPISVYMYSVLLAVIVPLIMGALFPIGAKGYESSVVLLHSWRSLTRKRKSVKAKTLRALKPMGFSIGGFFVFRKESTAGVFDQLMNYTVNAILSF